jgi:hypothetical protein
MPATHLQQACNMLQLASNTTATCLQQTCNMPATHLQKVKAATHLQHLHHAGNTVTPATFGDAQI